MAESQKQPEKAIAGAEQAAQGLHPIPRRIDRTIAPTVRVELAIGNAEKKAGDLPALGGYIGAFFTSAQPGTTEVSMRLDRNVIQKQTLFVSFKNATEKIELAKKCNEELWSIPEKGRERLLKQMGYDKEQIKYYMGGLDRFNDVNSNIIYQAESIIKNGAAVKDPALRETMAKSANALASSTLVAYTPLILWKAREMNVDAAKALIQLEDAHAYVAYTQMFNLYNMKNDINGSPRYVAEPNGDLERKYYQLFESHPFVAKAKSLDIYRKSVDEFYRYYSEYSQRQMAEFRGKKDIGEAKGLEKAVLIVNPYMEASVPLLMSAAMAVGGPGGFGLGALYFGNQARESFENGHYLTGSLISLTLMAPFFSALRAAPMAVVRTTGTVGGVASSGAGLIFQASMVKDAFGITFDAARMGWSRQDAAALMSTAGFMAMPVASARAAKGAAPEGVALPAGSGAKQSEPIVKPKMKMPEGEEAAEPKESGGTSVQLSGASLDLIRKNYGAIQGIMEKLAPALTDAVAKESDEDSSWAKKKSAESFAEELCTPDAVKAVMAYKNQPEAAAAVVLQFLNSAQHRNDVNKTARNLSRKDVVAVLGRIGGDIKTAEGIAKLFASTNEWETRACCSTITELMRIPGALEGVVDSFQQAMELHWPAALERIGKPEVIAALTKYSAAPEAARAIAYALTEAGGNSRDLGRMAAKLSKPEVVRAITAFRSVPEAANAMAGSFAALAAQSEGNPATVAKKLLDPEMGINAIVSKMESSGAEAALKRDMAIYIFAVSYKPALKALAFEICGGAGVTKGQQTSTTALSDVPQLMEKPELIEDLARVFPILASGKIDPDVISEGLKKFAAPDRQGIMSEYFHPFLLGVGKTEAKEYIPEKGNVGFSRWTDIGPIDPNFHRGYDAWSRVVEVEEMRPGICSALYKQNGIRYFDRYDTPTLLRVYDNLGKRRTDKPILLVFTAVADHNGALRPKPLSLEPKQDIIGDFWKDFDVHIVEAGSRYEAARRIIGISNTYGKPKVLYFNAHGQVDKAKLGWKEDEVVDVKGLVSGADISRYFDEKPTAVLASCSTGAQGGFAEQTQARFGNALMYAPKIPTATKSVKFSGMDKGWATFEVSYEEGDITAHFPPRESKAARPKAVTETGASREKTGKATTAQGIGTTMSGVARIQMELQGNPIAAKRCTESYTALVQGIAKMLKTMGIKPSEEERFITEIWGIMNGNLRIYYGRNKGDFLYESLARNGWDCDNSAFLVFDVAKELKVPLEIIEVPLHAFVATKNFFFETTGGQYYPIRELPERYPLVFLKTSDPEKVHSISYMNRAAGYYAEGDYASAVKDYTEAIRRCPEDAQIHFHRGDTYILKAAHTTVKIRGRMYHKDVGDFDKAMKDFTEAIRLSPDYADAYLSRGNAYLDKRDLNNAIKDYTEVIRIKPDDANTYGLRAAAYAANGDQIRAKEDSDRSDQLRRAKGH